MKKLWIILLSAFLWSSLTAGAQTRPSAARGISTPEMRARKETRRLEKELNLSEKQYDKVYKLLLRQAKNHSPGAFSGRALAEHPGRPGRGRRPGGQSSGGPLSERPNAETHCRGERTERPEKPEVEQPVQTHPVPARASEYSRPVFPLSALDMEKTDRKMNKILSDTQYEKWQVVKLLREEPGARNRYHSHRNHDRKPKRSRFCRPA